VKRRAFLASAGACAGATLVRARAFAETLNGHLNAIARSLEGEIGVYARTLAPAPPLVAYNASMRFPTASIVKVLIMTTAYFLEERHPGVLQQRIVYRDRSLIGGSDFLDSAADGSTYTVHELIVPMITVSDNTAANLLMTHLGMAGINAVARRAGMAHTRLARHFLDYTAIAHHNDNISTPADMGRLLYLIERGSHEAIPTIVSPAHCRAMLDIMLRQTDRDGIPAALPHGVAVANKTGEVDGTRNDIAVIDPFGQSPIILAIMSKNLQNYYDAYSAIHAVTRSVYHTAG
jgi:beta-lactamase class A